MNIVIINGPNLNLLGEREPKIYGKETLKSIEKKCKEHAKKNKIKVDFFQSNIEGEIVKSSNYPPPIKGTISTRSFDDKNFLT